MNSEGFGIEPPALKKSTLRFPLPADKPRHVKSIAIKSERLGLIPAIALLNNSGSGSEECGIQTGARVRTIVCMHRETMYSQKQKEYRPPQT
jgi:hypothetical protein